MKTKKTCCDSYKKTNNTNIHSIKKTEGVFYCPMYCEDNKTYNKMGDCPICGMDLISVTTYSAKHNSAKKNSEKQNSATQTTYQKLLKKLIISILLVIPIFIISAKEMFLSHYLTSFLNLQQGYWVQLILTLPILFYTCWSFFVRAYKSVITLNLNMFTLVGLGTGVAFIFSLIGLLFPEVFPEVFKNKEGLVDLYFEATAVILTLVLLGQVLEAKAHSQTNTALKELLQLSPTVAVLIKEGKDIVISIEDIKVGDLLRVKPGDKIPVDGIITEGSSTIDESMISGEPIPVDKTIEDKIYSGSLNGTKSFIMMAKKVGSDTLLAQIIKMVDQASKSKAPIQKLVDTISKYFVPTVISISCITFIIWITVPPTPSYIFAFVNALAVLIIACPCALGLATPISIMISVGKGARSGILIKSAEALQTMNKVNVLIIDKTGTLTEGKPSVEKLFLISQNFENQNLDSKNFENTNLENQNLDSKNFENTNLKNQNNLLQKIASVNKYSEHPLAEAIVKYAKQKNIKLLEVKNFEAFIGKGVVGFINNEKIIVGNLKLITQENISITHDLKTQVEAEQKQGKTISYIAINKQILAYISITDALKLNSKKTIQQLMQKNIEVIMMTGDNKNTAQSVATQLNIKNFTAECLPKDKLNKIKQLQAQGKIVAMAGDGINDSPALEQADVGIAMGTGTNIAIESAKITLVKGDLKDLIKVKQLSLAVITNIKQNLFFAFIYNILGIPIAAGVLFPVFGILLSPMLAATAMSMSSVSIIINSLRLKK